jgi:hypothetical protein
VSCPQRPLLSRACLVLQYPLRRVARDCVLSSAAAVCKLNACTCSCPLDRRVLTAPFGPTRPLHVVIDVLSPCRAQSELTCGLGERGWEGVEGCQVRSDGATASPAWIVGLGKFDRSVKRFVQRNPNFSAVSGAFAAVRDWLSMAGTSLYSCLKATIGSNRRALRAGV